MGSLSMLFYVVECFSVNLKTLGETAHQIDQIRGLHSHWPEVRNKGAQLGRFVFYGLLQGRKASRNRVVSLTDPAPQHVQLNFDAQKCLQNTIVKVAGDSGAFGFNGTSAQVSQKKKIFKGRANVTCNALQPGEVLFRVGLIAVLSVQKKEAPDRMISLIEGDGNKRMDSKLLLGQSRQARKYF